MGLFTAFGISFLFHRRFPAYIVNRSKSLMIIQGILLLAVSFGPVFYFVSTLGEEKYTSRTSLQLGLSMMGGYLGWMFGKFLQKYF